MKRRETSIQEKPETKTKDPRSRRNCVESRRRKGIELRDERSQSPCPVEGKKLNLLSIPCVSDSLKNSDKGKKEVYLHV
jgi:hypothetical protein